VYGNKPVVTVRADCEILYLRAWHQAFMPAALKTKLGIGTEAPAGADGAAAQPAAGADPAAEPPTPSEAPAGEGAP
jgi:hypothetical protein